MFHRNPNQLRVSDLCRDPVLAAIFRENEGDDMEMAEIDLPVPPLHDGAAANCRAVEFA